MNLKSRLLFALLATAVSLRAQTVAPSRITAPIDDSRVVVLHGNVHPLAQARFDRGPAAVSTPTGRLMLVLEHSPAQQQKLAQYLADIQNPNSPNYRKWLTPAQYGARFGISDADVQTVETWLTSHGLKIDKVPQGRNAIVFSGNIEQLQSTFHTSIHLFKVNGETQYANVSDPQIPTALAAVIAGVSSLNSFHPKPVFVDGPRGHWNGAANRIVPDLTLSIPGSGFQLFIDPADAATIYDTPNSALNPNFSGSSAWDGTGVNIGIVGVSDLTIADVQNYRQAFLGETPGSANIPVQIVDGDDPGLVPGSAADEALLDNEIAGGLAPKGKILYYTAADTDLSSGLMTAAFRAIDDNTVSILSVSFSACESSLGTATNQLILEAAEQAAAQGISFVVSTGDSGSAGCDDFDIQTQAEWGFGVNGFASTPYTVAVGGTDFDALQSSFATYVNTVSSGTAPYYGTATKYIPENPWNDSTTLNTVLADNVPYLNSEGSGNIIAGSGGVSAVYAKPSWQNTLTPNDGGRDLPDVSFLAGNGLHNATWVFCGDNSSDGGSGIAYTACQTSGGQFSQSTVFEGAGGTSASAPAFAGMLALVVQSQGGARLGQPNPVLYSLASSMYTTVFHDITIGNNSVPCATGSPNCGSNGFLTAYNAGTGYDLASGLGSLDVAKLVQNWAGGFLTTTNTTLNIDGSVAGYSGVHGTSLTFNVGVTSTSGGTAPTGNVAILDTANETGGGTSSGPQNDGQFAIPLTSGTGTADYNGLPGGAYTVEARYGGDAADAGSTSGPINVTITPEPSTTVLSMNAYNPITGAGVSGSNLPYGSILEADARVEGTAEGSNTQGLATGTVTFSSGSTALGTANIGSFNVASWPVLNVKPAILAPGSYSYSASYSGDASYNSSNSAAVPFTIVKAPTTVSATDAPTKIFGIYGVNNSLWQSFTVQTPYTLGAAPTGSVTITANGQTATTDTLLSALPQGSGASELWLISASGEIPYSLFQSGPNSITFSYGGDANYSPSSQTITITDTDGIGSFTMTGSGDLTAEAGLQAQEQLTFTPVGGFYDRVNVTLSGVPAGVNTGSSGGFGVFSGLTGILQLLGTPVVANLNFFTPFNLAPGTYPITATATDPTGKVVETVTFNLIVPGIPANAGISLSNGGLVSVVANSAANNSATVTLTPVNGFIGPVSLTCTVTTSLSNPISPPACQSSSTGITSSAPQSIVIPFSTIRATSAGTYTVTVTATDTVNPAITATTSFPLTILAWQGVFITINPFSLTIPGGASAGNTLGMTLTPSGGYTGTVRLSCDNLSEPANPTSPVQCEVPSTVAISGSSPVSTKLAAVTTPSTTPGGYAYGVNLYDAASGVHFGGTDISVLVQAGLGLAISKSGDITITPGATSGNSATITLTPVNGFTGAVNLSCSVTSAPSGVYDLPTCSLPSAVNITGITAATATLSIATTAWTTAWLEQRWTDLFEAGSGAVLAWVVFLGIPARRRAWRMLAMFFAIAIVSTAIGCGGGGAGVTGGGSGGSSGTGGGQTVPGTTLGAYVITVKAADAATGNVTTSTTVNLTVN